MHEVRPPGRRAARPDPLLVPWRGWPRASPITRASAARLTRASAARPQGRAAAGRRFRGHQDMILRSATDLTVGFTSNEAERGVRAVKVPQRTSGGCWRTLEGLADFAVVQSYLSTAAKWASMPSTHSPSSSPPAHGYQPPSAPAEQLRNSGIMVLRAAPDRDVRELRNHHRRFGRREVGEAGCAHRRHTLPSFPTCPAGA